MKAIYSVIDTNVLVSALITKKPDSATRNIVAAVDKGEIIPMVNGYILEEYGDVLLRPKFGFSSEDIFDMMELFKANGEIYVPQVKDSDFIDADDYVFYATYKMREDSYLVTGNLRHFPSESRIVSPPDMVYTLKLYNEGGSVLNEPQGEYVSEEKVKRLNRARQAIERMRNAAAENGLSEMTMQEIDEEIMKVRKGV